MILVQTYSTIVLPDRQRSCDASNKYLVWLLFVCARVCWCRLMGRSIMRVGGFASTRLAASGGVHTHMCRRLNNYCRAIVVAVNNTDKLAQTDASVRSEYRDLFTNAMLYTHIGTYINENTSIHMYINRTDPTRVDVHSTYGSDAAQPHVMTIGAHGAHRVWPKFRECRMSHCTLAAAAVAVASA